WRDRESGSIERAQSVREYSAAAFARVLRFEARAVLAEGATRRTDPLRRNNVVSAHHVAGGILALMVGLHHSSDSFEGAGTYASHGRGFHRLRNGFDKEDAEKDPKVRTSGFRSEERRVGKERR